MAEGGGLLNRYTAQKLYRGFESPTLRQLMYFEGTQGTRESVQWRHCLGSTKQTIG